MQLSFDIVFSSSLLPQAVYSMDDISSNLGETHPKTCPLYRNIGYHLLQKWQNKLAGRTKYFPTFSWPKKDVAKRTAKIQYLLAVAIALYSGIDSWERSELSGEFNGTDFLYIYIHVSGRCRRVEQGSR